MAVIFEFANFSSDFLQFLWCIKSTDWDFLINWGSCICCSVPAYRLLLWSMLHFSKNISSWNEAWFFRILCIFFFSGILLIWISYTACNFWETTVTFLSIFFCHFLCWPVVWCRNSLIVEFFFPSEAAWFLCWFWLGDDHIILITPLKLHHLYSICCFWKNQFNDGHRNSS